MSFKLWMERFVLSDAQWAKMEPHCPGKPTDPGRSRTDNRLFVEAVVRIVCTGRPGATSQRFSVADVLVRLFEACWDEPDMEYAMIDATIVKVHPPWPGRKRGTQSRP